ncbi:SRPBCC family protein [Kribbella sp. NPDC026611]|uniref:SRPBCC family protein n=1 Tax=Kribbella sp. NPDC026611 TaxID=3154911 RepID=UPI0033C7A345
MSENECLIEADAKDVFAVLTDGWLYSAWVVGASKIRDVDPPWPEPGGRIHHSVGAWPLLVNDTTSVLDYEPLRRMKLRIRIWPAGHGEVEFRAEEAPDGCRVVMTEQATSGPWSLVPKAVADLMLWPRNRETLSRLKVLAERRHREGTPNG